MFGANTYPICIPIETNDGLLYFGKPNGEIVETELALEMLDKLNSFYDIKTKEEIDLFNKKAQEEIYNLCTKTSTKERNRKRKQGFVYIFESGGKYKIGFSKNVEQRLKQLDTRPFKLNKVYLKYFENAFDIEQFLHNSDLSDRRIEGEWYELSKSDLNQLINWLENMTDEIFETL